MAAAESCVSMEVVLERTGERRYAVEVHRVGAGALRMDPAPGFDDCFPHDVQHLIVAEQLGFTSGIFGRLVNGGTATTFASVGGAKRLSKRVAARFRNALQHRDRRLASDGPPQFGRSERATLVASHDWLSHCPEPELWRRSLSKAESATETVDRMDPAERARLEHVLPRMRHRIDHVAFRWNALSIGGHLTLDWQPTGLHSDRSVATPAKSISDWWCRTRFGAHRCRREPSR